MMWTRVRRVACWLVMITVCAILVQLVYQIASESIYCKDFICQLQKAANYDNIDGLPLGAIVFMGSVVLVFVLTLLQLKPNWFTSIGRFGISVFCVIGLFLSLRIALTETILLHAWSASCVAASWLSVLLLSGGIWTVMAGHPRTRREGAMVALAAILVAGLAWHLMQDGGIPQVRAENVEPRLLASDHSYSLGSTSAKIQIVEFADFRCPPCQRMAPELRTLVRKYPAVVRLVHRELPNAKHHPQADRAAEIAECFGEQGKFWEASTELYKVASVPDDGELEAWSRRFGVAAPQFKACMAQHRGLKAVIQDRQAAHTFGISGTPTLFIGRARLEGAVPMGKLEGLVRSELVRDEATSQEATSESILGRLPSAHGSCAVDLEPVAERQQRHDERASLNSSCQ